jgi:hypothetical protein
MDTPTREHLARQPLDFYPTPGLLTWALLKSHGFVAWHNQATVLEPCNGEGAISDVLKESGLFRLVDTADIDPAKVKPATAIGATSFTMDATDPGAWSRMARYDWIITNPPYNQAPAILPLALDNCRVGMAMLLRLSYLEPCDNRARWLQEHPPAKLIVFNPRPRFRADTGGTDSVTSAWFIWHRFGNSQGTELEFCTNWRNHGTNH